jgi:hypothetical protein
LQLGNVSGGITNFVLTFPPGTTPLFLDYDEFHPRLPKPGKNVPGAKPGEAAILNFNKEQTPHDTEWWVFAFYEHIDESNCAGLPAVAFERRRVLNRN